VPFIFTSDNINSLLLEATQLGPPGSLRPHTYTTLFALLVTTGLRISEALALEFDDVSPDGLVIRRTKFQKSRLVPLHETAKAGLEKYLARRQCFASCDNHIFISLRGRVLHRSAVQWTFRSILKSIGLDTVTPARLSKPVLKDAKTSAATCVHCLRIWGTSKFPTRTGTWSPRPI
jgi:site-specific recombinase XerD